MSDHARDRWLLFVQRGGRSTFSRWCEGIDELGDLELQDRARAVLDDEELLRAVLAAVEAMKADGS